MAVPPSSRGPRFDLNPSRCCRICLEHLCFRYSCCIGSSVLEGQHRNQWPLPWVRATKETTVLFHSLAAARRDVAREAFRHGLPPTQLLALVATSVEGRRLLSVFDCSIRPSPARGHTPSFRVVTAASTPELPKQRSFGPAPDLPSRNPLGVGDCLQLCPRFCHTPTRTVMIDPVEIRYLFVEIPCATPFLARS
jgi:hypothetical protein